MLEVSTPLNTERAKLPLMLWPPPFVQYKVSKPEDMSDEVSTLNHAMWYLLLKVLTMAFPEVVAVPPFGIGVK